MRFRTDRKKLRWIKLMLPMILVACCFNEPIRAQTADPSAPSMNAPDSPSSYGQTTADYNRRLSEINRKLAQQATGSSEEDNHADYRIGPDDQLDISVLEAGELDRSPRVSASGEISLGLIGTVRAAGLTARELEIVIEALLRQHYIKEPHVSVQVKDMQSHTVAVFGAVKKPGVFQIRGPKTVVELLSMAEGLDVDAGDTVIVERRNSDLPSNALDTVPPALLPSGGDSEFYSSGTESSETPAAATTDSKGTIAIDLKQLLSTGDPRLNVLVYPGDLVKVPVAGLVYVIGEVTKPGGFELKSNENVSVLQAIALAQGLTRTSSSGHSRIIRTDPESGKRQEIPIDLKKILEGKAPDPMLEASDIVFVPNSTGRAALYRGMETAISIGAGVAVYRP